MANKFCLDLILESIDANLDYLHKERWGQRAAELHGAEERASEADKGAGAAGAARSLRRSVQAGDKPQRPDGASQQESGDPKRSRVGVSHPFRL